MDGETPASGVPQGTAETTTGITTAATDTTAAATTGVTAPQPEPQIAKPDITSLMRDPEYRKLLFADPEVQRELDHRAESAAGRRVKEQMDRWQRQQDLNRQEADLDRVESLDEYEAGVEAKKQAAERRQHLAQLKQQEAKLQQQETLEAQVAARLQPLREQEYAGAIANVYSLAQEAGATPEELVQLDPRNYATFGDFLKGAIQLMGTKEGKKLAKDMAKVEAKAMVEEMNRAERDKRTGPVALPPTGPTQTDEEYAADYASGRSDNSARQLKWMKQHGII